MTKSLVLCGALAAMLALRVQELDKRVQKLESKQFDAVQCTRLTIVDAAGKSVITCDADPKTKGGRVRFQDAEGRLVSSLPADAVNKSADSASASVIETKMDDDFEGFEDDKVYKLFNGQIWHQTSGEYEYEYAYMPDVLIYKSGGVWKMRVEGCSTAVTVERLK